jgi:hypothetical protein
VAFQGPASFQTSMVEVAPVGGPYRSMVASPAFRETSGQLASSPSTEALSLAEMAPVSS